MDLHHVHAGRGEPLLLIHGLGGTWRSWRPILSSLVRTRELFVIDLPGHGASARLPGRSTFATLTDAVESFVRARGLEGVACAGISMGARMALELARRGVMGPAVALDPGGFWEGWERRWLEATMGATIRLLRAIDPFVPALARTAIGRTLLCAQVSAHPWRLEPDVVSDELRSYVRTPVFDELLHDLAHGPGQEGVRTTRAPVTIVWGRRDRLSLLRQSRRAITRFPSAHLVVLERCGHFPQWDQPDAAVEAILTGSTTRRARVTWPIGATRGEPLISLA